MFAVVVSGVRVKERSIFMKKLICIAVFLLLVAPLGLAEPILFFSPQSPTISVGNPITVDVMISGVVSPWLGSYDITVDFNSAITPIFGVAWPDDFLGVPSLRDADFSTAGSVRVTETSLDLGDLGTLQSGKDSFRLFEIMFSQSLAPGTSPLTFTQITLADGNGSPLLAESINGSIGVGGSPVPEPGSLLLLGISAIGALGVRKKLVH